MKAVVAIDSFKGSMDSIEAGKAAVTLLSELAEVQPTTVESACARH